MMHSSYWKNKTVAITGGAGFIGSNLAVSLVAEGSKVRVIDNLERGTRQNIAEVLPHIEFLQLDLRDLENSRRACSGVDVVFHLAAKVGGIGYYLQKPGEVISQTVKMDSNIIHAALENNVKVFFYASSAHVYPGHLQSRPDSPLIKEEDAFPANPDLSYGWAKLLAEKQLLYLKDEDPKCMKIAIARLIGIYGKNQDCELATGSVIPVFSRRAVEYSAKDPFTIWGTGEETRSYCFINDALDAIKRMVVKAADTGLVGPLNIGKTERLTIAAIARKVVSLSGKDISLHFDKTKKTTIWGQLCDCSRAKAELGGWEAATSLEDGLKVVFSDIQNRLKMKIPTAIPSEKKR